MAREAKCLVERFWSSISATTAEGCWSWNGPKNKQGYGRFMKSIGERKTVELKPHRFSYELIVGEIDKDLTVDHTCRNKSCVNPSHLEIVSRGENAKRAYSKNMEAMRNKVCTKGHKVCGENVLVEKRKNGVERKRCKLCSIEKEARRKKK
jgi:hypothetical protein